MKIVRELMRVFTTLILLSGLLSNTTPIAAQDIVGSDDISGGSAVFVFRKSSKSSQAKAVTRSSAKRTVTQRTESKKVVREQVAKATPKRTGAKKVDPNTIAANVKPKPGPSTKPDNIPTASKLKASEALAGGAEVYLERGEIATAISYFREAIKLNPNNVDAKAGLSEALTRRADELSDTQSPDAALPLYQEATQLNKENAAAYAGLGTAYGELEKDDLALPNYEKALALNAGLTELYSPIGIAYYEKGDFAKSDEYLSKAMAARPQDAETKYFLALVRYKQGRNDEAISALKQSIAIKDTPEAHYYLGEVYDAVNREADAISEYKRAIALNPAYKEAWFDLGAATYNRGKYNEAVEAYSQALKLDNQNAEARANLADVYRQLKQYAKAESEYNLATLTYERMPKEKVDRQELAELYSRHGFVLGRLAKWNSAIVALEKALAISPDKVDYTNIGWAYLSSAMVDRGNKKEAEAKVKLQKGADNLNKAVALDPNFIGALLNLGVTYKELGNYSGAIQALAKCVDLRKNWLVAHNELGLSYFYSNDYEKASGQFKKVTEIDKNFADGYFNLAVAEFKRGDLKAARKAQDKLKDMKYLELAKRLEYVFSGASITGAGGDIKKN